MVLYVRFFGISCPLSIHQFLHRPDHRPLSSSLSLTVQQNGDNTSHTSFAWKANVPHAIIYFFFVNPNVTFPVEVRKYKNKPRVEGLTIKIYITQG
jgi:hypothetical protein